MPQVQHQVSFADFYSLAFRLCLGVRTSGCKGTCIPSACRKSSCSQQGREAWQGLGLCSLDVHGCGGAQVPLTAAAVACNASSASGGGTLVLGFGCSGCETCCKLAASTIVALLSFPQRSHSCIHPNPPNWLIQRQFISYRQGATAKFRHMLVA